MDVVQVCEFVKSPCAVGPAEAGVFQSAPWSLRDGVRVDAIVYNHRSRANLRGHLPAFFYIAGPDICVKAILAVVY